MRWFLSAIAAFALAISILSIPAPFITSTASATKMDGKLRTCSDSCQSDKYKRAMKHKGH